MSKENLSDELAAVSGRCSIEADRVTIMAAVVALRASAVAEPVEWRYGRKDWDGGIWRHSIGPIAPSFETPDDWVLQPLYTHPAPAAPVPAIVREALEPFVQAMYGVPGGYVDGRTFARVPNDARCAGTVTTITFAQMRALIDALASLPAPEAAPTREEIIEQCAAIAIGWGCQPEGRTAILALKAAPAK